MKTIMYKKINAKPATRRYAFASRVPASFIARHVNDPLSCAVTLIITSV